ncbi:MAG TPA: PDZ domain-containing protein [Candidatus Polarisedimenticolaceae bacterium]|nr:PDZ domain-containing protein [Candidatus Polarisedimenticolaceae bacterium]
MRPRNVIAIFTVVAGLSASAAPPEAPAAPQAPAAPATPTGRVWLGVFLGDEVDGGVQILEIVPGGPAAKAGLNSGDIVIRIDGKDVAQEADLTKVLKRHAPGETVGLTILRGGETKNKDLVLGTLPRRATVSLPAVPPVPLVLEEPGRAVDILGIEVGEIPPELRTHLGGPADAGLLVVKVAADGVSAKALKVGDLLVSAGGTPVASEADLDRVVFDRSSGPMTVAGRRSKAPFSAEIELRVKSREQRDREARARMLEMRIRQMESQLDELRRQLRDVTGAP